MLVQYTHTLNLSYLCVVFRIASHFTYYCAYNLEKLGFDFVAFHKTYLENKIKHIKLEQKLSP